MLPGGTPWVSQTLPPICEPFADAHRAQDGGARVDHHVILHVGVALDALDGIALLVQREALGAQSHALIDAHALADGAGLADDHARAVVDEEALADGGAGMDVDARGRVGQFRDDARDAGEP